MTMRHAKALGATAVALLALAGCQASNLADSAATPIGGVGFGDYESYLAERQAREAQVTGRDPAGDPRATGAPGAGQSGADGLTAADLARAGIGVTATESRPEGGESAADLARSVAARDRVEAPATDRATDRATDAAADPAPAVAATGAPLAAPGIGPAAGERGAPAAASASDVAPAGQSSPVISDEQDFAAVSSRETIQSDAARLERQRAAFTPIAPAPLPERGDGAGGADIVAYALSTSHAVGETRYRRTFASTARARRACDRYSGDDLAQRAFLEAGGPERDRFGLDPDGDGFACTWSPTPFRAARG